MSVLESVRSRVRLRTRLSDAKNRLTFRRLFAKYRQSTMIQEGTFIANLMAVEETLQNTTLKAGAIVECGTWRGGMSAAMMELGGDRPYYFLDSFEGLPPVKEIDGKAAAEWQADTQSAGYHDNCTASIPEFMATLSRTGMPLLRVNVIKGFFEQTLPSLNPEPIAVLRLDGDWYDSTMVCLKKFWDLVLPGGAILIDDYYTWDGCSRAVHDFLSSRQAPERIRQRDGCLAVITKESGP